MSLFDSHCHLNHPLLMAQHEHVRTQMNAVALTKVLVPSTCLADWPTLLQLPALYPEQTLLFALGVHPYFLPNDINQTLSDLGQMLADPNIRQRLTALGEIGLDFVDKRQAPTQKAAQIALFKGQLALAQQHGLPIVLHSTHAVYQCLQEIKALGFSHGGYAHAFGGSVEEAKQMIALGFKIGIGPMIYHKTAKKFQHLVEELPPEALALETDAPYPLPKPIDLKSLNLPSNVAKVKEHVTAITNRINKSIII